MKPSLLLGPVLLAGLFCLLLTASAPASPPPDPSASGATITFANGDSIFLRARSRFRSISLQPGETISLALQLPPVLANQPAVAQALDGGALSASDFIIAADGSASLVFQVPPGPGNYRLLLGARGRSVTLNFEVAQP